MQLKKLLLVRDVFLIYDFNPFFICDESCINIKIKEKNMALSHSKKSYHNVKIDEALVSLEAYGINTTENQEAICCYPEFADKISIGLKILNEDKILTPQNRLRICAHANVAGEMASAICSLYKANIYTFENWELLARYSQRAMYIAANFSVLDSAGILANNKLMLCDVLINLDVDDAIDFGSALFWINMNGKKLTQDVFEKLCSDPKHALQIKDDILKRDVCTHFQTFSVFQPSDQPKNEKKSAKNTLGHKMQ